MKSLARSRNFDSINLNYAIDTDDEFDNRSRKNLFMYTNELINIIISI